MTCSDSASAAVPCDDEAALRQHQNGIGKSRGQTEIMRHHDHQRALIGGGAQAFHDIDLVTRIERGRRLVRQDHRRFHGEYARQRHAAALAAGQFSDAALAEFHDVGRPHRPQHRLGIFRRQTRRIGRAMRIATERHDILRRQRPVHDMALRQIGETPRAFAQGKRRQRVAADINGAGEGTSPAKARNSVVLPAPFGPTSATRCPDGSASEHRSAQRGRPRPRYALRAEKGRCGHATPPPSARRSRMIR